VRLRWREPVVSNRSSRPKAAAVLVDLADKYEGIAREDGAFSLGRLSVKVAAKAFDPKQTIEWAEVGSI
jgi:hypothetical protein